MKLPIMRNPSERIWVVRSTSGQYVSHFLKHGLVAIGHLDKFLPIQPINSDGQYELSQAQLKKMLDLDPEMTKAQRTSHASQVRQLLTDMAIGDMVVTLDSSAFALGRVAGFPYFDDAPLPVKVGRELKSLPYQLRLPVTWGPRFPRHNLPLPLERVFYSHRTVFEITDYWQYIYHLLYPAFVNGDDLFLSFYIGQNDEIRTKDISRLINALVELEALAHEFGDDDYVDTLTLKASFFSKGPFWPRLKAKERKSLLVLAGVTAILGAPLTGVEITSKLGSIKVNGLLNTEAAKVFIERLGDILQNNESQETKKKLQLHVPGENTQGIESPSTKPTNTKVIMWA